jgi:hypothetical protein
MAQSDRYHGGTAVDFGTARVIHRSVIHPAHRSSELPSQPARSVNEYDFKPAKLLFGASMDPHLAFEERRCCGIEVGRRSLKKRQSTRLYL